MEKKVIFPFSRIHNPMLIELWHENGVIKDVNISDTLYRGFEQIMTGRDVMDLPYYTQRICGICSSAHALVSAVAIENALGMTIPPNAYFLRNLIFGSDLIHNHLSHFYFLSAPDYFRGPDIAPFIPHPNIEYRLSPNEEAQLTEHYYKAFEISRDAHSAFGIFGGKAPHGHGIVAGGITSEVNVDKINRYKGYLSKVIDFVDHIMIPDLELLFERYPEMIDIGKGPGNYMSSGGFLTPEGESLFTQGVIIGGKRENLNEEHTTEGVSTAWYKQHEPVHPNQEDTEPDRGQPKGYSWIKAPRYKGYPMEQGPLARAIIAGEKVPGYGALSRLWARTYEIKKVADKAFEWLERLEPGAPTLNTAVERESGSGSALLEVMRGTLGYWVEVEKMRVKRCQIVTPSAWNFSSRDEKGYRSPAEFALLNLKVTSDFEHSREIGGTIRSFDPCFSCSVHIIEGDNIKKYRIR